MKYGKNADKKLQETAERLLEQYKDDGGVRVKKPLSEFRQHPSRNHRKDQ
jgi:hypothetical protein